MQFNQISVVLLLLCFLSTLIADTSNPSRLSGDVSVNCGSSGNSVARDGTEWLGDVQPKFPSLTLLQMKGSSTASRVTQKLVSEDDPVPYSTARLSRSRFSYAFKVNPGQKILRLHFNPASYKGYKRFKDLIAVDVGHFTLLNNFSASLTAYALGVNSFVKEFYVNIEETRQLDIVVSPASSQSLDAYAFINGIEIVSVPASLSYFHGLDTRLQVVGKSPVYVDSNTALEVVQRISLKQDFAPSGNVHNMFGMWGTIPKQKYSKMMNNVTWNISVDVGFRYLIRLYFSILGLKIVEISGTSFKVHINEMTACTYNDIVGDKDDEDSIPMFKDYMVMMKGCKCEGKRDVLICLESDHELIDGHGPLKGFEVLKLSNHDNSLASPNPNLILPGQNVSYRPDQDLHYVLGPKNIMFIVAIRLLALVSIIIYTLCEILEARGIKEENIPSARAELLCRRFSLADMRIATRNFSDVLLIGRGGFGQVYKGIIDNGLQTVAIKRLKSNSNQGASEFLMEIETLTEVRHVNLVSLIGYCNENGEMILVYEYMACGTLADRLYKHDANGECSTVLTWKQRLIICIGVGRGLDYLHTGNSIIHRDVKTSNILLDESFRAKVSDFGLAKHLSKCKLESHVSTKVKGTFGYIDPNYVSTAKLTMKSDTYAFGVVLLEVLSGRRAVDHQVAEDEQLLTKWARENISKGRAYRIVDQNLSGEISEHSLHAFLEIADKCLHDEPNQRPTMAEVVLHLIFALEQQECPKPPAPNELTSCLGDVHPFNGEANLSISTKEIKFTPIDVQNKTPSSEKQAKSKVVIVEPLPGGKDQRKSKKHRSSRQGPQDAFQERVIVPAIELAEIKDITDHFSSKRWIADGSSGGSVFRGSLRSGHDVAIKKLYKKLPDHKFLKEVLTLSSMKHENVAQLLGYCMEGGLQVLVYEFAPQGSLHDILHGQRQDIKGLGCEPILSWAQRIDIAIGIATGLLHLHESKLIHHNIRSSNVLLFDNGIAKITDLHPFTKCSCKAANDDSVLLGRGYHPPECAWTFQSEKGDVYSFGMVLLELLTGHELVDKRRGPQHLVTWTQVRGDYPQKAVAKMAVVAASCVEYEANSRPSMRSVLRDLQSASRKTRDYLLNQQIVFSKLNLSPYILYAWKQDC